MEERSSMNRRGFFQTVAGLTGLALLTPHTRGLFSVARAEEKRRGAAPTAGAAAGAVKEIDLPLVEPGKDPAATGVSYVFNHKDVKDSKLKIERQGVAFEKQLCDSPCGFYTKVGQKGGDELGKCTIFPNKLVKGKAWCSSWNKKA